MTRKPTQSEQTLVDIAWQLTHAVYSNRSLQEMSIDELATWVGKQLRSCGYENEPLGSAWHHLTGVKE